MSHQLIYLEVCSDKYKKIPKTLTPKASTSITPHWSSGRSSHGPNERVFSTSSLHGWHVMFYTTGTCYSTGNPARQAENVCLCQQLRIPGMVEESLLWAFPAAFWPWKRTSAVVEQRLGKNPRQWKKWSKVTPTRTLTASVRDSAASPNFGVSVDTSSPLWWGQLFCAKCSLSWSSACSLEPFIYPELCGSVTTQ